MVFNKYRELDVRNYDIIMPSFLWTAEEIEIYLNGAKNLLSSNTVEDVEKYDLLQECECFLLYLRSLVL